MVTVHCILDNSKQPSDNDDDDDDDVDGDGDGDGNVYDGEV